MDLKYLYLLGLLLLVKCANSQKIDSKEVKCLVCEATVREMQAAISKIDPKKKIGVGNFRLDSTGDTSSKSVPFAKSEMYLTELMENICDKMDDYAKARYKDSGVLTVLKMISDTGGMNTETSKVDFVQDGDLNKSLKHFCLEVLEDNEEHVLSIFTQDNIVEDVETELCTNKAGYCKDVQFAFEEVEEDEYKEEL